ncbi:MAG: hypothetical protein LBO09_07010 [Candidatus Peribacteria bacterium]|jgi:hypothetical protein|nr:hypothetical protein [Candidatus Peribacteria bacterium]
MDTILNTLRKSISQHYRGNKMIGTIAMNCVKEFFQIEKKADDVIREKEPLEGYVKNEKLFLKTTNQAWKIEIFKQKKKLIELINTQLATL